MLSSQLKDLANEFQSSYNLSPNTTDIAFIHDSIHAITGLSASLSDEELVLNVTEVLSGGFCNPKLESRVLVLLDIILQSGYAEEIINYLNN